MKKRLKPDSGFPEPPGEDPALLKAVQGLKGWRPANEVLVNVRSVPTRFLDFDRALKVGGLPLGRLYTAHGPTSGGKSAFLLGLAGSFVEAGMPAGLVDAEHTTPEQWTAEMIGAYSRSPLFLAKRPQTYEETIKAVDEFIGLGRPGLLIVDSINKLTPAGELEAFRKQGPEAARKGTGRARANLNQAWIDHLTPLLAKHGIAMIMVAQERTNQEATAADARYGQDYHVKGGAALLYDASALIRIERASWIQVGEGREAVKVGARHRVRIHKSKVEWLDGAYTDAYFHLSNGAGDAPEGFDFARDLVEVGVATGVIKSSGAWYYWGKRRWQGSDKLLVGIRDPQVSRPLEQAIRAAMGAAT